MITVHVKLFSVLRQNYPGWRLGEAMPVELPAQASVRQLIEHLALPADLVKVVFVNNRIREDHTILQEGDQVGIFPPVGGG